MLNFAYLKDINFSYRKTSALDICYKYIRKKIAILVFKMTMMALKCFKKTTVKNFFFLRCLSFKITQVMPETLLISLKTNTVFRCPLHTRTTCTLICLIDYFSRTIDIFGSIYLDMKTTVEENDKSHFLFFYRTIAFKFITLSISLVLLKLFSYLILTLNTCSFSILLII